MPPKLLLFCYSFPSIFQTKYLPGPTSLLSYFDSNSAQSDFSPVKIENGFT